MLPILIFDDGLGALAPLTDLRAAFEIRTGALTTLERALHALGGTLIGARVPETLAPLVRDRLKPPVNAPLSLIDRTPLVLALNGRCVLLPAAARALALGTRLIDAEGVVIAATLTPAQAQECMNSGRLPDGRDTVVDGARLLTRPWHVRSTRDACLAADLSLLGGAGSFIAPPGVTIIAGSPLQIRAKARIEPGVILDASKGAIFIGDFAHVRPGAIIVGPAAIGEAATVLERTLIKANTVIGPHCKVAGEIGGTIFQGYSNKAHEGHLGDSWIGEWVNLGAGTTNSNLLNTYSEVITRATPEGPNERTGETFLGAVIGDHVKTAICTRIMTGAVLHTGSMFAQTAAVSGCVPAFSWSTDEGRRPYRFEKFREVVVAAMQRRDLVPSPAYLQRLEQLAASSHAARKG